MSDARKKSGSSFKKRAHRPWKTALLETTVQETATIENDDNDLFDLDLDLNLDINLDTESFYPEFNFTEEKESLANGFDLELQLGMNSEKTELHQEISENKQQQNLLVKQLNDKSGNALLLGGFFQPQQVSANHDSQAGRKINSLLSDLKAREQKLSSLTNNLKISEAYERAEQAELSKRAANQQLQAAENRMRQAVEQAKIAEEQFLTAMEQAKQAALAHQEEARMRRDAENTAKEAKIRANNAEIELQNERLARIAADEKAQHAFMLAEKASLFQRQLNEASEQLVHAQNSKKHEESKRLEVEQKYSTLNENYVKLELDHKECSQTIKKHEQTINDLTNKYQSNEQIAANFNAERDKLKAIIAAEQDLRKMADRKYQEAAVRADKAEQGWQKEVQQRRLIEERAKRAVANASRTVLHLLNTPGDADIAPPPQKANPQQMQQKPRKTVPAVMSEDDYDDDDLLF